MLDLISLVSFFVIGIIGWLIYEVYIWPYYITPLKTIPGPQSRNPFYDSLFSAEGDVTSSWVKKYGNVIKYHGMFNKPTVLVADPNIVHEIAVNQVYDFVKPVGGNVVAITGNGILFAEGENHKRQRKMMNPAFAHVNIKEMVPAFTRVSLTLKSVIEDKINVVESRINLTPIISKATLDIIGLVGFNYEFNSLTSTNELADAYAYLMDFPQESLRIFLNFLSNSFPSVRKLPIDDYKKFNNACKVIDQVSKQLVEDKYREDKDNNKSNGKDLLSLLINTNKTLPVEEKMTDEELKYQIMTFLIAGHETTSTSTSWALYLLAQHPDEQDLLREELVKAFPDKSKFDPTFDEINSLEYLNCIVKETLRLYSPVANISRINTKDKVFGEHFIPKNTTILIPISALHRLPSIWGPTAEDFDPKRWLDSKNVSSLNYLPFYSGTRTCIGNKLALAEFKLLLSMLIRNFVFKPVEGFHISKRSFSLSKLDPHLELIVSEIEA